VDVRAPTLQCRASITFHHLDGQNVFGRMMERRWSSSPEPILTPIFEIIDGKDGKKMVGKQVFVETDLARLGAQSRIDVYPGESQLLDIVVRADDDGECYGWNNEGTSRTRCGEIQSGGWSLAAATWSG
jgi:hypothetical protein